MKEFDLELFFSEFLNKTREDFEPLTYDQIIAVYDKFIAEERKKGLTGLYYVVNPPQSIKDSAEAEAEYTKSLAIDSLIMFINHANGNYTLLYKVTPQGRVPIEDIVPEN
jgi:hypothetical protein